MATGATKSKHRAKAGAASCRAVARPLVFSPKFFSGRFPVRRGQAEKTAGGPKVGQGWGDSPQRRLGRFGADPGRNGPRGRIGMP